MSRSTRSRISEQVRSLREADLLPFHDILDAKTVEDAPDAEGVTFHERLYTPLVTACLSLSQVIDPDHSCRGAVARPIAWLAIHGRKPCSPETGNDRDASPPTRSAHHGSDRPSDESPWGTSRIRPRHLDRSAIVHVRQSTAQQVLEHRESAALSTRTRGAAARRRSAGPASGASRPRSASIMWASSWASR